MGGFITRSDNKCLLVTLGEHKKKEHSTMGHPKATHERPLVLHTLTRCFPL